MVDPGSQVQHRPGGKQIIAYSGSETEAIEGQIACNGEIEVEGVGREGDTGNEILEAVFHPESGAHPGHRFHPEAQHGFQSGEIEGEHQIPEQGEPIGKGAQSHAEHVAALCGIEQMFLGCGYGQIAMGIPEQPRSQIHLCPPKIQQIRGRSQPQMEGRFPGEGQSVEQVQPLFRSVP